MRQTSLPNATSEPRQVCAAVGVPLCISLTETAPQHTTRLFPFMRNTTHARQRCHPTLSKYTLTGQAARRALTAQRAVVDAGVKARIPPLPSTQSIFFSARTGEEKKIAQPHRAQRCALAKNI